MSNEENNRERFQRARKVFLQVMEHEPASRDQVLADLCQGDQLLREEVASLLANTDADTNHLMPKMDDAVASAEVEQQLTALRQDFGERPQQGQSFADRYVLEERIGEGGMGEVWRARDRMLGETVALKFIRGSGGHARDQQWIGRLLAEVSAARKVTHGNVCRVHDVGTAEHEFFISMEFVDGLDLRAQLRASGRLDAAASRRLAYETTSALAAIHRADLLHRDLKPANVLVNDDGSTRLSDFGLAISPLRIGDGEALSGTQAYMAPEVLRGDSPSTKSDLYALGLVLYEAVTNRRVFQSGHEVLRRAERGERPPAPALLVPNVDPVVDRVIRRCLAPAPEDRPESAEFLLHVLEFKDPLDAVMALGDQPSADVIAAASAQGMLGPATARLVLALFFVLLTILLALEHWTPPGGSLPAASPDEVAARAQSMLEQLDGGQWQPVSRRFAYSFDEEAQPPHSQLAKLQRHSWRLALHTDEDSLRCFWLRESSKTLSPMLWSTVLFGSGRVTFWDPPATTPGLRTIILGSDERLLSFQSTTIDRPTAPGNAKRSIADSPDAALRACAVAIRMAHLDPQLLRPAPPILNGDGSRQRTAWLATNDATLRVEAELAGNRLLAFHVLRATGAVPERQDAPGETTHAGLIQFLLFVTLLAMALPLAIRHFRSGRGDYTGAARLALACGVTLSASWYLAADYSNDSVAASLLYPVIGMMLGLGGGAGIWLFYMAVEPSVQRDWPRVLVALGRLLRGRFGDPLVRSHVLIGLCIGLLPPLFLVVTRVGAGMPMRSVEDELILSGSNPLVWFAELLDSPTGITIVAMQFLAAITFLRLLCRSRTAAVLVFALLQATVLIIDAKNGLDIVGALLIVPLMLSVLLRLGVLAFAAMSLTTTLLFSLPIASSFDDWFAGGSLFAIGVLTTMATLAGAPLTRPQ